MALWDLACYSVIYCCRLFYFKAACKNVNEKTPALMAIYIITATFKITGRGLVFAGYIEDGTIYMET